MLSRHRRCGICCKFRALFLLHIDRNLITFEQCVTSFFLLILALIFDIEISNIFNKSSYSRQSYVIILLNTKIKPSIFLTYMLIRSWASLTFISMDFFISAKLWSIFSCLSLEILRTYIMSNRTASNLLYSLLWRSLKPPFNIPIIFNSWDPIMKSPILC